MHVSRSIRVERLDSMARIAVPIRQAHLFRERIARCVRLTEPLALHNLDGQRRGRRVPSSWLTTTVAFSLLGLGICPPYVRRQ